MKLVENRFERKVAEAARDNLHLDRDKIRRWQAIDKMVKRVPLVPEPEPAKPRRLQPIPLALFQ